jgi:hypothetical protein
VTLQGQLNELMQGRPGWGAWEGKEWCKTDSPEPGVIHTRRYLNVRYGSKIHARKYNGHGQPCDVADFDDVAEALAWVELPRSEDPIQHRMHMEEMERYARRDDIDLDGLKGKRVDSGLNPKRQHFDVVDFDGKKVRITSLGEGRFRVAYNRKTETVQAANGDTKRVVAGAVRRLAGLEVSA